MSFPKEKEDLMREHLKRIDMTTLDAVLWLSYAFSSTIIAIQVHDKELYEKLKSIIDESFSESTTITSDQLLFMASVISTPMVLGRSIDEPA